MRKSSTFKTMIASLALGASLPMGAQNVAVETGAFSPDWTSLSGWTCPEWFKDAKFGIWAHWGPQCEPEDGDWYARGMYDAGSGQYNYHVAKYGDPADFGFKDVINEWKAEEWNPDALIALYKSAGARYFMTLGQHHDNFDLWDSPYQEWNSVNMGPRRDIVKGWSEACQKHGLPLGVSMHGAHTWTWLEIAQDYDGNLTKADGAGKWWEGYDPQELYAQRHTPSAGYENSGSIHSQWDWGNGASQPSEAYKTKFQNRVLECINDYNPSMLYFDDTVLPFYGCDEQVGLNILAHYYNHSASLNGGEQQVVVMGKKLNASQKQALLWDVERGVPDRAQSEYWQTCTCIGSWHYDRNVYNGNGYKSAQQVVDMLVDVVSKNGNLLLSVPIRGNGTIDEKERAVLDGIKAWMDVNGKSIYATRPWKTFGEGPLAEASNPLNAQGFNEKNNYSSKDVRYVQRNDTLYATILRWPAAGSRFTLKSLGYSSEHYSGEVAKVTLLGHGEVPFAMDIDGLSITLPAAATNAIAPVFEITFDKSHSEETLTLQSFIDLYEAKVAALRPHTSYNTGKFNAKSLNALAAAVEAAKAYTDSGDEAQQAQIRTLNQAYADFLKNGRNEGGQPGTAQCSDETAYYLTEATNFTRTPETDDGRRFGAPRHWTVENFNIPNGDDGTKHGIDKYKGNDALMLGVWNDQQANTEGDLANARIYQTVRLEAGRYYFGANYNAAYELSDEAYLFAAPAVLSTSDIPEQSIAYERINRAKTDGSFHGITFTLDTEQDVVLGFQANLTGGSTQEFRADAVKLLYYGEMDYMMLDQLMGDAEDLTTSAKVNTNTGFYRRAAVEQLRAAMDAARQTGEDASYDELSAAYNALGAAIAEFQNNGKNPGGTPSETAAEDMTEAQLVEAGAFSRSGEATSTRYATPAHWTVENYRIDKGGDGVRNGLDRYPGYDCLSLGIWDDRQDNEDGDISNARIYRTVRLPAGRYYFGAQYQTTQGISRQAYIFATGALLATPRIPADAIAYEPINKAGENDGNFYGIYFTLEREQDVKLGFQADLSEGSSQQEFRAKNVKLFFYGAVDYASLQSLARRVADTVATLTFNHNTGFYAPESQAQLLAMAESARALSGDTDFATINETYSSLSEAFELFLTEGKNKGGQPEKTGATDITASTLGEADNFTRTTESGSARFGTPAHWTVENFRIPNGSDGTKNGLDKYSGDDCLMLGIWDDRDNNTEGDLADARIYRKVRLEAGRYYFGNTFNALHNLAQAYIFAASEPLPTDATESKSIAYAPLSDGALDGNTYGIYFTLDAPQDVVLGFQANLAKGDAAQEFRASSVTLLRYDDPSDGIGAIGQGAPAGTARYYSLMGTPLPHAPLHGLYIVRDTDGKAVKAFRK